MKICRVSRHSLAHPGDISSLKKAIDSGEIEPDSIQAVIGKMEGNGGVNDFTRGYFTQSLFYLLAEYSDKSADELKVEIPCVLSGGTEGVMSPHYVVFSVEECNNITDTNQSMPSLALGRAMSEPILPQDIGRMPHISICQKTVEAAISNAGLTADDVCFVQVKSPAIPATLANELLAQGLPVCSTASGRIMALSRAASAWGVGVAMGELKLEELSEAGMLNDFSKYSAVASISSGLEVDRCEVVVLGNSRAWAGDSHIAAAIMKDALDLSGPFNVLEQLDISPTPPLSADDSKRIQAVLVKCEPARSGKIRGNRHTMLDDTDIDPQRHIRGAIAGMVASVVSDGRIFVSGGAEHQGPDEGGLLAVIAKK